MILNRMNLLTMIAVPMTLLILPVYSFSQPLDEKDISIISDACSSLNTKNKKAACADALTRIIGNNAASESTPAPPKPSTPGTASEEITFKGIPLGQAGQSERLLQLCAANTENHAKNVSGVSIDNKCKIMSNLKILFSVDYGTYKDAYLVFQLDEQGALVSIKYNNIFGEPIVGLVKVLSDKYGSPLIENEEIQNRLGSKFPLQIYHWTDARGNMIEVKSSCEKIGQGCFQIKAASLLANDTEKVRRILNEGRKQL